VISVILKPFIIINIFFFFVDQGMSGRTAGCRLIVRRCNLFYTFQPSRPDASTLHKTRETTVAKRGYCGREMSSNFTEMSNSTYIYGSFTCCKSATWDRRLCFPSKGRRAPGAPSSNIISHIYLQHVENSHLPHLKQRHNILNCCRYVDDVRLIIETQYMKYNSKRP
jgi:hypothetical protein